MEGRRRELALAAVAVVTIVMAAYLAHRATPAPPAVTQPARQSSTKAAPTSPSGTPAATPNDPTAVHLQSLKAPKTELPDTVRDPFRFKPKPPPPPPPPPRMTQAPPQPTGPVEPPPPPRITLKFFMTAEVKGKGLIAALSDGQHVYQGVVGDTIEGRYRILRIGVESIDLAYLDGRGKQTIRLTGQ